MAVESPMMPTNPAPQSFYLSGSSPASPIPYKRFSQDSPRSTRFSGSQPGSLSALQKEALQHATPTSPYPQFVDPSPVDSNGTTSTETTEIEDDETEHVETTRDDLTKSPGAEGGSPRINSASPLSPDSMLGRIDTSLAARTRADSDAPQSVIHAPQGFMSMDSSKNSSPVKTRQLSTSPTESTGKTIVSPRSPEFPANQKPAKAALNTDVPPVSEKIMATPRAQTRQELEEEWKSRKRRSVSLEGIPEGLDNDEQDDLDEPPDLLQEGPETSQTEDAATPHERQEQIQELKDCLAQAWGLCTTFSSLSSQHRTRIFKYRGKTEIQGQAWRSCWRLCQHLYESREDEHDAQVLPTLDLCREFCQALFDARQKGDETSDSIFRVSFELNTHLYNAHDRGLPLGFQIRTLDFYLTLCHRLMKLPTSLPDETDQVLRACWHLVEMLFSLRQNNRERKAVDEDFLTAAIEACYDLTDIFREGWSQTTFSRATSRAAQSTISQSQNSYTSHKTFSERSSPSLVQSSLPPSRSGSRASQASQSSTRSYRSRHRQKPQQPPPETPTTVFDDTQDSIDMLDDDHQPNILVLGPPGLQSSNSSNSSSSLHQSQNPNRWTSAASAYSESSQRTSSTATVSGSVTNIDRLRVLLVHVAKAEGWVPRSNAFSSSSSSTSASAPDANLSLLTFVRAVPSTAFGDSADMRTLLEKYRKMVADWPLLAAKSGGNPMLVQSQAKKVVTLAECGRAILWMMRNQQYAWLETLFRRYLKCTPEEALRDSAQTIEA